MARNFYTFAEKQEKQFLAGEYAYTSRTYKGEGRVELKAMGRPLKNRLRRKPPIRKLDTYENALRKCLNQFSWTYFGTGTFDKRKKSPLALYDNFVIIQDWKERDQGKFYDRVPDHKSTYKDYAHYTYSRHLCVDWEPTTWEPTATTIHLMMNSLMRILSKKSLKNWKCFYAIEEHKSGSLHVHFLIGNDKAQKGDIELVSKLWRWMRGGYIRIDPILKQLGSIDYVMKYITKDLIDWDFLKSESYAKEVSSFKNINSIENLLNMREMRSDHYKNASSRKWYE